MSLSAAEIPVELERARRNRVLDSLDGVREGSRRRARSLSDADLDSRMDGDLGGEAVPGPDLARYFEEAYKPDPDNDRARWLEKDLKGGVELQVWCDSPIGTRECLNFGASESAAYLHATANDRALMRNRRILERHLDVADAAARRLREQGATSGDPGDVLARLSAEEAVVLRAFGGLVDGDSTRIREAGTGRFVRKTPLLLSEGFEMRVKRARRGAATCDAKQLREALGFGLQGEQTWPSPMSGYNALVSGWSPGSYPVEQYLQVGPNQRQMLLNDVWDEQAKCAFHYARDPTCKQAIKIKTNYVLGRGFKVTCDDDAAQEVVDEFFDRMKLNRLAPRWLNSLGVRGEIFLREVDQGGGRTGFVKLSAPSIWEVHTDPEDIDSPIDYVQRYRTRYQLFAPGLTRWVERVVPAAEVIHYKVNADDDEVRGRGDPYAALPWHLRFTNYWDARAEKDYATAAFQYYALLDGTMSDVKRFIANSVPVGRSRPGGWLVFNNKVKEVGVVKSDVNDAAGTGSSNNGLLNVIAMNYQISKTYLGVEGNTSRAGAAVQAGPAEKGFEERQDDAGALFGYVVDRVLARAQAAGLIAAGEDALQYRIEFPTIIKADADTRIKNIVVGRAQGFVSRQTGARMWAQEMDIGDVYDFDDEQNLIKDEADKGIGLPGLPKNEDPMDPNGPAPGAGTADPATNPDATGPDSRGQPRGDSAAGQRQIRKQDTAPVTAETLRAIEALQAVGAVVVLP